MKAIDKIIDRLEKKLIRDNEGLPVLYAIYNPAKDIPNIVYHSVHPDLHKYGKINELSKALAIEIRKYYGENPGELERIKQEIVDAKVKEMDGGNPD